MTWIILLVVFLVVLTYLLWVPILLVIDSSKNQYFLQIKGLAKAQIVGDKNDVVKIRIKVLFFNFYVYPLRKHIHNSQLKNKKTSTKKRGITRMTFKTVSKLLKTFKVERFYIDIDTGDCISNAKLFPIFALFNYYKGGFNINFEGRNNVLLSIQNRPIRLIKTFINI